MKISPFLAFVGLMAYGTPLAAKNISWDEAIDLVDKKASAYYEYAQSLGSGPPGTALNGLDADRHRCSITGRMLGFKEEIRAAEMLKDPRMSPDADPMSLMAHAATLDAWVASARYVRSLSKTSRQLLWNLECVGDFSIPLSAHIQERGTADVFTIRDDTLYVYADFDDNFSQKFEIALSENEHIKSVAIAGMGDSVEAAMRSGRIIREKKLKTILIGPCISACPFVFAGGLERIKFSGPKLKLGFHKIFKNRKEIPVYDRLYHQAGIYLEKMDIRANIVISWMLAAPKERIRTPSDNELIDAKIFTWTSIY